MKKLLKVLEVLFLVATIGFAIYILYIPFGADLDNKLGVVRESGYYANRLLWAVFGTALSWVARLIFTLILNGKMYYIMLTLGVNLTQFFMRALVNRAVTNKRETIMITVLEDLETEFQSKKVNLMNRRAKKYGK